jgi:hypothetical protein
MEDVSDGGGFNYGPCHYARIEQKGQRRPKDGLVNENGPKIN